MPDRFPVAVLGQGAVGRAVAARLRACGYPVRAADREGREGVLGDDPAVLVLALTRGEECERQLREFARLPRVVVDLTTQTPDSARRCAAVAARLGSGYHGGGLSRGGREVAAGRAVLLLGPPVPVDSPAARVVAALGGALPFPDPGLAALAKLLHNWVLLVQQWAAALALRQARAHGLDALPEVLAAGTTGRPVAEWSVVRDAGTRPCSTYLSRLAAKDLHELARTAPGLARSAAPLLAELDQVFGATPEDPFTAALLRMPDRVGSETPQ